MGSPLSHRPLPPAALGLALVLGLAGAGCTDNPACIFGGDCSESISPGIGAGNATFPVTGQWIRREDPTVGRVFPSGGGAHSATPVVIVFSESMRSSTVQNAFELMETQSGLTIPLSGQLVGDGRVLVAFPGVGGGGFPGTQGGGEGPEPMDPLVPGSTYEVRLADDARSLDLTGQILDDGNGVLGSFTVADPVSEVPAVVTTWPADGDMDASALTEMVVVFDRAVDAATVTAASLSVTLDGMPLSVPPVPFSVLETPGVFGGPGTPEPRVWTFRNEDDDGNPVPLWTQVEVDGGANGLVEFSISPATAPISNAAMDMEVAPTTSSFELATVFPPAASLLMSMPTDAIGIRNLVDPLGGEGDLALEVMYELGLEGDVLDIFVFGVLLDEEGLPFNAAFARQVVLDADMNATTLSETQLDLASSLAPLVTIVEDGDLGLAFRIRRGGVETPVHVFDADLNTPGVQDLIIDTTPPTLVHLGPQGDEMDVFRTDQRDVVLFGRADEELREVDVEVTIGAATLDNGTNVPVLGSTGSGFFLAAPVTLPMNGVIDPNGGTVNFTAVLRDRALNTTETPISGEVLQVGSTAPGTLVAPGGVIIVDVIDALTLQPLANALVATHQDDGGTITSLSAVSTDSSGVALVNSATVGETIVTAELPDYDIVSFHGVTTNRVSLLVPPSEQATITQSQIGIVEDGNTFASLTRRAADSRIAPQNAQLVNMPCVFGVCSGSPFIRANRFGIVSALGAVFPSSIATYSAQSFLRAFAFDFPRPTASVGGGDAAQLRLDRFLDDPGTPDEELAVDWTPAPRINPVATTGFDIAMLLEDPTVAVQSNIPGFPGSLTVGLGVTFDDMAGGFDVRAAYAGVADGVQDSMADELGQLVQDGVIEADLRLRVEMTEIPVLGTPFSNRAGARPKLSAGEMMLFPLGVPTIQAPVPFQLTGPSGIDVVFDGTIFDGVVGLGKRGLYVVTLTDSENRRWILYRPDQNNLVGETVTAHAPDIDAVGGTSLVDEDLVVQVSAYAWPGFDLTNFLWTDIEREYDLFAHTRPTTFNNPMMLPK